LCVLCTYYESMRIDLSNIIVDEIYGTCAASTTVSCLSDSMHVASVQRVLLSLEHIRTIFVLNTFGLWFRLSVTVPPKFFPLNVTMQPRQQDSIPYIHSSRNRSPYSFPYISLYSLKNHFHITNLTNFNFVFI
jgi:hypothetical protein